MSYAEVVARLRAAQELISVGRLQEARRIILDEIRPALHEIALDSRTYELHDALGLLGAAADDLEEVVHAFGQVRELTDSWIADTGGGNAASTWRRGSSVPATSVTVEPAPMLPGRAEPARAAGGVPPGIPAPVWRRIQDGHRFNVERRPFYPANEVRLATGKVVDSYEHEFEIIERKHSQLAAVRLETAIGYLRNFARKYSPGQLIADTPVNVGKYPDLVGEQLDGDMVLEVPVQDMPVPRPILEQAAKLNITIRDTEGTVYRLSRDRPGQEA